jgi:hypothetical protein
MHPIAPISAAVDDLGWLAGRWLGQDSPRVPGDEFRYRRG